MSSHNLLESGLLVLALGCALTGAITDVQTHRIPNWLTGPAMLAGLGLHLLAGGWREGGSSLLSLLLCGALFLLFHLAGGMGAGDVKLIAAEACLLNLQNAGPLLLHTVLCGGVMGLALAIRRGQMRRTFTNVLALTFHHSRNGLQPHPELNVLNTKTLRLPYAVAIASGCVLTIALNLSSGSLL